MVLSSRSVGYGLHDGATDPLTYTPLALTAPPLATKHISASPATLCPVIFTTPRSFVGAPSTPGLDAGGEAYVATDSQFAVACGCDGAPAPAVTDPPAVVGTPAPSGSSREIPTTPAPEPTTSAMTSPTASAAGGDCPADESLGVTSTAFPLLEGCLEEMVLQAGGELEYLSSTGLIAALPPDETDPTLVRSDTSFGYCRIS